MYLLYEYPKRCPTGLQPVIQPAVQCRPTKMPFGPNSCRLKQPCFTEGAHWRQLMNMIGRCGLVSNDFDHLLHLWPTFVVRWRSAFNVWYRKCDRHEENTRASDHSDGQEKVKFSQPAFPRSFLRNPEIPLWGESPAGRGRLPSFRDGKRQSVMCKHTRTMRVMCSGGKSLCRGRVKCAATLIPRVVIAEGIYSGELH